MCGIAGFVEQGRAPEERRVRLETMLRLLAHRGPDHEGTYHEGPLSFGMRRLSIIDLAGGEQPIWNEDGTVGVVFNGEIYNYLELREALQGRHQFRTHSDTEVLVHLYEEHGADLVDHLRGMFAFAIVDRPARRLLLARDHFGQKPLYYAAQRDRLVFASELKSLLCWPEVGRRRRREAFLDYCAWLSLPAPHTHFEGISKLPAGSRAVVPLDDPAALQVERYWQMEFQETPRYRDAAESAERLDAVLADSLRVHLRSDVPVGILLSSGLDSRAIAHFAQRRLGGRLKSFSVGFAPSESSELPEARAAAERLGTTHFEVLVDVEDYRERMDRVAWHLDEPVGDPAALAVWKVCELARKEVKVVLSGEGSDELFGGYAGRYRGMLQTMARGGLARRFGRIMPRAQTGRKPGRWQRLLRAAGRTEREAAVALRQEGFPGDVRHPRGLRAEEMERLEGQVRTWAASECLPQRDRLSELLALDIRWQLAESLLQKADKMSMAASLELRSPFLDVEMARFSRELDSSRKLAEDGRGKAVLRDCVEAAMPGWGNPQKKGFPVPLRQWLAGRLRDRIEGEVFAVNGAVGQEMDRNLLRSAWEDHLRGEWDGSYSFYGLWLYEVWAKGVRQMPGT